MKIKIFLSFLLIVNSIFAQLSYDDLHDQSGGIEAGFGAWGAYSVLEEDEIVVAGKGVITCYHPAVEAEQLATIFFISGWGKSAHTYEKYFHFLASLGYTIINVYNTDPGNIVESYENSLDMILLSKETYYTNWINTSQIALMGHSYGAGSTIWLGKQLFSAPYYWGAEGRFIFMTAPWYSLLVTADDLRNYPDDVKLVIEISNDDLSSNPDNTWNTDERAIRAVFELINIPDEEKDFIRVFSNPTTYEYDSDGSGTSEIYSYDASHFVSYTGVENGDGFNPWDALDVYAINRVTHALISYVFEGDEEAKTTALGNGSPEQIDMDFLTNLQVTDHPVITRPEEEFNYKCNTTWNDFSDGANTWFLQAGCDDSDGDGDIDLLGIHNLTVANFSLYPVPTSNYINIRFNEEFESIQQLEIRDATGKIVYCIEQPNSYSITTTDLASGTYFVKIETATQVGIQSFIIK